MTYSFSYLLLLWRRRSLGQGRGRWQLDALSDDGCRSRLVGGGGGRISGTGPVNIQTRVNNSSKEMMLISSLGLELEIAHRHSHSHSPCSRHRRGKVCHRGPHGRVGTGGGGGKPGGPSRCADLLLLNLLLLLESARCWTHDGRNSLFVGHDLKKR